MRALLLALFLVVLLTTGHAHDDVVQYTFTGDGLSGTFCLDNNGTWQTQPPLETSTGYGGIEGFLESPKQAIWGSFGGLPFRGTVRLHFFDQPAENASADIPIPDFWIPRATLEGPYLSNLSLFVFVGAAATTYSTTMPRLDLPYWEGGLQGSLEYSLVFPNGTSIAGQIHSLTAAPGRSKKCRPLRVEEQR